MIENIGRINSSIFWLLKTLYLIHMNEIF
jgi:hypothetical protein